MPNTAQMMRNSVVGYLKIGLNRDRASLQEMSTTNSFIDINEILRTPLRLLSLMMMSITLGLKG